MTTEYTRNFRFALPDFRMGPWHDLVNGDFVSIDELLMSILQGVDTRPWTNNYPFKAGMTAIDTTDNTFWVCILDHTSAPIPTTFAQDRVAHPTYWNRIVVGVSPRGDWKPSTHYLINDIVVDSIEGIIAVCNQEHTSSPPPATIRTDAAYWNFLTDFHGTSIEAIYVKYNNVVSGVSAVNVQQALDLCFANHVAQGNLITTNTNAIAALDTRVTHTESVNTDQDNRINAGFVEINTLDARIDALEAGGPATKAVDVSYANFQGEPFTDLQEGTSYLYQENKTQNSDIDNLESRVATIEAGGGAGSNPIYVSDTPPLAPPDLAMWLESDTGQMYFRYNDGNSSQWMAIGSGGGGAAPSLNPPLMDGVADVGVGTKYSREDHVHPSDSKIDLKVAKAGDTMTGQLTVPNIVTNGVRLNAVNGTFAALSIIVGYGGTRMIQYGGTAGWQINNVDNTKVLFAINEVGGSVEIPNGVLLAKGGIQATGDINATGSGNIRGETLTLGYSVPAGGTLYFGNNAVNYIQQSGTNFIFANSAVYLPGAAQNLYTGGNIYTGYANAASGGLYFGNNGTKGITCNGTDFNMSGGLTVSGTNGIYVSGGGLTVVGGSQLNGNATVGNGTAGTTFTINGGSVGSQGSLLYWNKNNAQKWILGHASIMYGGGSVSDDLILYSTAYGTMCTFTYASNLATYSGNVTVNGTLTTGGRAAFNGGFTSASGPVTIAGAGGCNTEVTGYGGGYDAFLSFHRPGAFGCNFGLGTDANLWYGGWSFGAGQQFRIWTTRDFASVPTVSGVTAVRLAMAADYAHTAVGVTEPYGGAVVTGGSPIVSGAYYYSRYRWLQQLINGGWGTVGLA